MDFETKRLLLIFLSLEQNKTVIKDATWTTADIDKYGISEYDVGHLVIKNKFKEYDDTAHIFKNLFKTMKE